VGRAPMVLGALLVVGGGAALGFALTRTPETTTEMTADQARAMGTAKERLEGDLKEAHTRANTRVSTFVSVRQQLGNGLASKDKATVTDQVYGDKGGEGKLDLAPGEVLEVGYVEGDSWKRLVSQPRDAAPSGFGGKPASHAKLVDDHVMIYEVVEVKNVEGTVTGYATLGQPSDLKPAFDALAAAGLAGRFELGDDQREIGGPLPAGAETKSIDLREPGARIVVAMPAHAAGGRPTAIIGAGAAVAALGAVLVIFGLMPRKKPAPDPAFPPGDIRSWPTQPSGGNRMTQPTTSQPAVAAGTPAPGETGLSGIGPHDLGPGAMIGRWEILRRLGSGGMADVYLAHSKGEAGFEKLVAIKVMHPHLTRNEKAVAHFLDEARLAARISHPNVVQILDLGKIGDDYVIVMEYVEGVDLERLLVSARAADRPVPIGVGLGILCKICDGLHAAHTAVGPDGTPLGIIHRDVKSANVLVSKQGIVKVVDFGIAKAATQSHLTAVGETKGTPSMMAPEQRVGEQVDVRADVYSVAAVGYEIVTGHAVNLDLAALAHLGVENWPHLPVPSSLRGQLPPELDQLLLGAMAFEREQRPADCGAFEGMFEAVMKTHGLTASDKDIARWVDGELRQLIPAFEGAVPTTSRAGTP